MKKGLFAVICALIVLLLARFLLIIAFHAGWGG
jgi:hypothetical protein